MTLEELLAAVNKRGYGLNRIGTAEPYLKTVAGATGTLAPRDLGKYAGATWEAALKASKNTLVYRNDDMKTVKRYSEQELKNAVTEGPKPIAMFDAVLTSIKQDRDGDILHPDGAEIDPSAPLLWQHNPVEPIGRLFKTLKQDKDHAAGQLGIADIPLGHDAAYLTEFGALRISHGFKPKEFQPIQGKDADTFSGFDILKYEMMEVSLVSVPSNTDAIITAFSRMKLGTPIAKSWAKSFYMARPIVVRGGWSGMRKATANLVKAAAKAKKTGRKKASKAAGQDFEDALAAAASTIKHSGDYGYCFYSQPDDTKQEYTAWWTSADGDSCTADDGTPMSTSDEIKQILSAVPGVTNVTIEAESTPPKDEGWRMVYPEAQDWVEQQTQDTTAGGAGGDTTVGGAGTDTTVGGAGTGGRSAGKGKGRKDGTAPPVAGSMEHIAELLQTALPGYLAAQGVVVNDGEQVCIVATYADPPSVVVCVGPPEPDETSETQDRFYQIGYTVDANDTPTLSGVPVSVELQTIVVKPDGTEDTLPAGAGDDTQTSVPGGAGDGTDTTTGGAGGDGKSVKVRRWVLVKRRKGKLTKKDHGDLTEALEHITDALARGGLPNVTKTLIARAGSLVEGVVKAAKAETGQANPDESDDEDFSGPNPGIRETPKGIMSQIRSAWQKGAIKNAYALTLLFDQLGTSLMEASRQEELSRMGQ